MIDHIPFAVISRTAGLTRTTTSTGTMITTDPNETMAPIHDRMPDILAPSAWEAWLDPTNDDSEALAKLLVPAPADLLVARPVSTP